MISIDSNVIPCLLIVLQSLVFPMGESPAGDDLDVPSLSGIMKQQELALSPPVRYRIRLGTMESTVSVKRLSDGTTARRAEAVYPSQTITISHGDNNFEILPQSRIVIDKTGIKIDQYLKGRLRGNENSLNLFPEIPPGFKITSRELVVKVDGNERFYEITTTYQSMILEHSRSLSPLLQDAFPAIEVLLVNANKMMPVERRFLSRSRKLLQAYEYLSIEHPDDLSDELFQLPADYDRRTPSDLNEYYDVHKSAWAALNPGKERFWPRVYASPRVFDELNVKLSYSNTGPAIGSTTVSDLENAATQIPTRSPEPVLRETGNRNRLQTAITLLAICIVFALLLLSFRSFA